MSRHTHGGGEKGKRSATKEKAGRGGWARCRGAGRAATRSERSRAAAGQGAAGRSEAEQRVERSGAAGGAERSAAGRSEASGRDGRRGKADWRGPLVSRPGGKVKGERGVRPWAVWAVCGLCCAGERRGNWAGLWAALMGFGPQGF
jgi:hypothetical protein